MQLSAQDRASDDYNHQGSRGWIPLAEARAGSSGKKQGRLSPPLLHQTELMIPENMSFTLMTDGKHITDFHITGKSLVIKIES